jgi:hypothetical protein
MTKNWFRYLKKCHLSSTNNETQECVYV